MLDRTQPDREDAAPLRDKALKAPVIIGCTVTHGLSRLRRDMRATPHGDPTPARHAGGANTMAP
jgi:hypothetical protein